MLPSAIVRRSVSPTRGTGSSLPVSRRRNGRRSGSSFGRTGGATAPPRWETSTAMIGPSAEAAIASTGRLFITPPSTSRRPASARGLVTASLAGDYRRVDAGDREARVDRLRRRAGAVDDELAGEQVGRDAEEAVLELLDPAVAEHLAEQLPGARAADQRVGGQRVVAARVLLDEAAHEDLVQDVGRGAHGGDAPTRSSPCSRPRSGRSGCPAPAARRARRGGRRRARRRLRARARSSGPRAAARSRPARARARPRRPARPAPRAAPMPRSRPRSPPRR